LGDAHAVARKSEFFEVSFDKVSRRVLLAATAALIWPPLFAWFQPFIVPGLGLIMFGMGTTLNPVDFKRVAEQPYTIGPDLIAQFLIMPFATAGIAKLFGIPPALAPGLLLVGSCPGGTASNVMAYLAKGDVVALSVTMTSCSTNILPKRSYTRRTDEPCWPLCWQRDGIGSMKRPRENRHPRSA
jgi:predicted Na+-dependent transporter